jgi:hypothetical protein
MSKVLEYQVKKGAAWLDIAIPNWKWKIQVSILDMEDPYKDIIGQIFGSFYNFKFSEHDVERRDKDTESYGFDLDCDIYEDYDGHIEILTQLWKNEICC